MSPRLFQPDANTVAHIYWDGGRLVDTKGNTWTQTGTVPMVGRRANAQPGSGPYSDLNFYSLGAGSDVLDFSGDFMVSIAYRLTDTSQVELLTNTTGSAGYDIQGKAQFQIISRTPTLVAASALTTPVVGEVLIGTVGKSGTTLSAVLQNGGIGTTTCTWGPATTAAAKVGGYPGGGFAMNGTIFEIHATTTAFTAAAAERQFRSARSRIPRRI